MFAAQSLFLMGWNWYDWFVALALLYGVWSGVRNGLVGEILWTVGMVTMVLVAVNFYEPVGNWLGSIVSVNLELAHLIAFIGLALIVYILTLSIRQVLHNRMKNKGLLSATVQNFGGAIAGVVRMAAVMSFVTICLCLTRSPFWHQQVGKDSWFGAYVVGQFPPVAEMVHKTFPEKLWFLENVKRREDPDLPQK